MGVEPYLLASTINLIIAQRLVRRICEHCKEPVNFSDEIVKRMKVSPEQLAKAAFYQGKGCKSCRGTGYLGRLPIFEFLVPDNDLREKITNRAPEAQIRGIARQRGYGGLLESGVKKILAGLTTPEEVFGVAFMEDIQA
jgi:type II secretory ATPase GspE/PulE/Tfp pilus assembly ATPase PilB-like protein